jgi:hypothetical protein
MATPTYTLIDSEVLASSAASVEFTSIPADYRDLVLVIEAVDDATTTTPNCFLYFNDDETDNYLRVTMSGNGSSASSSTVSGGDPGLNLEQSTSSANGKFFIVTQIFDYSATDKHKTLLSRANGATTRVSALAARWPNTSAINKITLDAFSTRAFAIGSTFYLYGIEA